ncbi:CAP domain-containing protein [Leucothrix arctica]|uniref:SCP domain-containing protein n=1 Tax=Leucothrix arctica TaxID=1481894 RepID=A0A317CMI7_9GAMM|nr:hypothetical protein [Leucothrix arctica]PWQ99431.1 hypothetical protein DKT75_00915 [Leucothrix arctica]
MIKQLPLILITSLLLAACGGSSSGTDDGNNSISEDTNLDTGTDIAASPEIGKLSFICSANATTESLFTDTFVEDNWDDTSWSGPEAYEPVSVEQIASSFNTARNLDPTIKQKLLMPQQADWNAMTSSEKGLFLVNSERCARGLEPFEGISPELIHSSSSYANELSDSGEFSHSYGLYASPSARLSGYADVEVGTNADWMAQAENLSRHTSGNSSAYPTVYEPIARAIYTYLYDDSSSNYGHRTLSLIKIANENSGDVSAEGLFGLSKTTKQFVDSPFFTTDVTSVMHVFDPNENWDMSNVLSAPTIYGPETITDCMSGTFIESVDESGNNTSHCQ